MKRLIAGVSLMVAAMGTAQAESICVIVNGANKQQLELDDIKSIYSDAVYTWDNGDRITVYNLPPEHPGAEIFARNVLGVSARQAAMLVSDRNITNTARNQQQVREEIIVAASVARNRNAIGYVSCHFGERPDAHIVARLENSETAPVIITRTAAAGPAKAKSVPEAGEAHSASREAVASVVPVRAPVPASPLAGLVLSGSDAQIAALLLQKNPRVLYQSRTGVYRYYVGGQFDANYDPKTTVLLVADKSEGDGQPCQYTQGHLQSQYEGGEVEMTCGKLLQKVIAYLKR